MKTVNTFFKFGEEVNGYNVPVLNEREIRAAAGIMFLVMFVSLVLVIFQHDFLLIKYVVVVFMGDLAVRVVVSPTFSPSLIIGRLIVSGQVPEYVGAPPKKFAWKVGLVLSGLMFFLLVILNSYSALTAVTCLVCLAFLFFESAFGICLGCIAYAWVYKTKAQHCAGEICNITKKKAVQKISRTQLLSIFVFIVYVLLTAYFFSDHLREAPRSLWKM